MAQPAAATKCAVAPFVLRDSPALIECLLPVQKLSAEAYKEQMAVHGKSLTALGSYWKGRKPPDPGQGLRARVPLACNG